MKGTHPEQPPAMTQTDLFGVAIEAPRRKYDHPRGYFRAPGTGPADELCRTCKHAYARASNTKNFWKCDLVAPTRGPGTDIRLKSPACSGWQAKEKPAA